MKYQYPMFERLQPRSEWRGGRLAHTDLLTLEDAARFASKHAGEEVSVQEFLFAAGKGEIALRAIVRHAAKVRKHDGGVLFNKGAESENIVPAGSIPTLPLIACQHLANTGRASWRTFDGFEMVDGQLLRYTKGMLTDDEPDFETVLEDCRVSVGDVHALADEYCTIETELKVVPSTSVAVEDQSQTQTLNTPLNSVPATLLQNGAKKSRRDLLTPVIEAAQKDCEKPFDAPSVWASLTRMANAGRPPLVGVSEDGIKWINSNDEVKYLNLGSLRSRLQRSARRLDRAR